MIHRNLTLPHRFVLLTDEPDAAYNPLIEPVKLWTDHAALISPRVGEGKPNCYVKLKAFSEKVRPIVGDRFVSIDLDCVVTGNLDAILGREEDFVIWRRAPLEPSFQCGVYQSSMWMLKTGSRRRVWNDFHGKESLRALVDKPGADNFLLTDQGWILYKLGENEATWGMEDGVYDWRWLKQTRRERDLPENAKIVFFPGTSKPWNIRKAPEWVSQRHDV